MDTINNYNVYMLLVILLSVIGGITLLFWISVFIFGKIFFETSCRRRKGDEHFAETEPRKAKNAPDRKWLFSRNIEEITITSFDGLKLKGFFIKNDSNKLAITVHGYHGRYYSLSKQAQFLYENGYNLLMINNRCHDTSEGKVISMGKNEAKDLYQWMDLMIKRNPEYQILLFGVSMGAHIVMMTLNNLPQNVKCAVEDCGYSSLYSQMIYTSGKNHVKSPKFASWCGNVYALVFHHFSFRNDTKNTLKDCKVPLLLMHGDKDNIVPFKNLDINASYVNPNVYKETHVFTDCDHCEQIKIKGEEYALVVNTFINKFIK